MNAAEKIDTALTNISPIGAIWDFMVLAVQNPLIGLPVGLCCIAVVSVLLTLFDRRGKQDRKRAKAQLRAGQI